MYRHILVLLDGSGLTESVLSHTETIVRACNIRKITMVRVVEPLCLHSGLESRFTPKELQNVGADITERLAST
jgi:hypothetical protein